MSELLRTLEPWHMMIAGLWVIVFAIFVLLGMAIGTWAIPWSIGVVGVALLITSAIWKENTR